MFTQISSPAELCWQAPSRSHLMRLSRDLDLAADQLLAVAEGCTGNGGIRPGDLALELPSLRHLELLAGHGKRWPALRLQVDDTQLGALHRRRALLSRYRPVLLLTDCKMSLARCVQFLTSLQLPVEVAPPVWMTQDPLAMTDLSARLLFSPFIKTPVQPFFDLLRSQLAPGGGPNLWDISRERVGRFVYITADGQLTLSKRWADARCFFGGVPGGLKPIYTSDLYHRLRALQSGGHQLDAGCRDCRGNQSCAGYMRAIDGQQDCRGLLAFLDQMAAQTDDLRQAYRGLSVKKRRSLSACAGSPGPPKDAATSVADHQAIESSAAIVLVPARCTNACIFCAPADERNQGRPPSDAAIESFIEKCGAKGVGTLIFSGNGEPTLHHRLPEFIACAAAAGIRRRVITSNGSALSSELLLRLKRAGTDGIVFSLHGIDATHDGVVRREGSFGSVQRSLRQAQQLGLGIGLNTCLVRDNLHQLEALVKMSGSFCTMPHTLTFPEWSGRALRHTDRLPTYAEAKNALAAIDWEANAHAALDNFPLCHIPAGAAPVHRPGTMAHLDHQGAKGVSSALNFGNNQIPERCLEAACTALEHCCGVDRQYLRTRGSEGISPIRSTAGNRRQPGRSGAQTPTPPGTRATAACHHGDGELGAGP